MATMREPIGQLCRASFWLACAFLAGVVAFAGRVSADQSPVAERQALARRLDADEIAARALEVKLAIARRRSGMVQVADLFGPSEEEQQREQAQDSSITQLNQRVGDLEDTLRHLTGQVEQLQHRIDEMDSRIERMQKDFDYKLCTMAGQQLGVGGNEALPCNPAGAQPDSGGGASAMSAPMDNSGATVTAPSDNQAPIHLAKPPGVLGTLSQSDAAGAANQQASLPPPPPSSAGASGSQFDMAMTLMAKAQYDEARSAFRAFADANPKDPLTPQAIYWVGDIAFVQKDYPNAARTFAEEIKRFPASARAPESMLRLGQSLIAMNQKQEGCTALAALASKYPNASKNITGQAAAARQAAGCR